MCVLCVCVPAVLLTNEYLPAHLPFFSLSLSVSTVCVCACVSDIVAPSVTPNACYAPHNSSQILWTMEAQHLPVSYFVEAAICGREKSSQKRGAAASDLCLTPTATARDPGVGKRSCQTRSWRRKKKKSQNPTGITRFTHAHPETLHPRSVCFSGSETCWQCWHVCVMYCRALMTCRHSVWYWWWVSICGAPKCLKAAVVSCWCCNCLLFWSKANFPIWSLHLCGVGMHETRAGWNQYRVIKRELQRFSVTLP